LLDAGTLLALPRPESAASPRPSPARSWSGRCTPAWARQPA